MKLFKIERGEKYSEETIFVAAKTNMQAVYIASYITEPVTWIDGECTELTEREIEYSSSIINVAKWNQYKSAGYAGIVNMNNFIRKEQK